MMQEAVSLLQDAGVSLVSLVVLGYLAWMEWGRKNIRIEALEKRIEQVDNGQRAALERRFDASVDAERRSSAAMETVGRALEKMGGALHHLASTCPLFTDSDADAIKEATPTDKEMAVIRRRAERVAKAKAKSDAGE
jgi:hypothetical protein